MPVEAANHISELDPASPTGDDKKYYGDDNLRLIKKVLVTDLALIAGPVTLSHTQINATARALLVPEAGGLLLPTVTGRASKVFSFGADGSADTSISLADLQASVDTALGAANFKGNWSDLTGALNKPACVKHAGRFWLLLNNLANVTTSQPGVSADWTILDAGSRPTALVTGTTVGVSGVLYIATATAVSLTAPTSWIKGDYFGWADAGGNTAFYVDYGATRFRGRTVGQVLNNVPYQRLEGNYEDSTRGLV